MSLANVEGKGGMICPDKLILCQTVLIGVFLFARPLEAVRWEVSRAVLDMFRNLGPTRASHQETR